MSPLGGIPGPERHGRAARLRSQARSGGELASSPARI